MSTHRLGIVSDLHVLSKHGLVPPGWRLKKDPLRPLQAYLWKCWKHFTEHCPPLDDLLVNGDIVEGDTPFRGSLKEGTSDDPNDQVYAAIETLGPLRKKATRLWLVRGTPAHDSKGGDVVEAVARELNAEAWPDGRRSGHVLDLNWYGLRVNASHHLTRGWVWLAGNASRMAVFAAASEAAAKAPPADVIIRGDLHTKILAKTLGKWVLFSPAWTMPTLHAIKKMEATRAYLATDIGATVLEWDGERIAWREYDYSSYIREVVKVG